MTTRDGDLPGRAPDEAVMEALREPKVRRVIVNICEPCIKGEGQECHTPSCILYLHAVDIPFMEELMEDVPEPEARPPEAARPPEPGAAPSGAPTGVELREAQIAAALTDLGMAVTCLYIAVEKSVADDVRARYERLRTLLLATPERSEAAP